MREKSFSHDREATKMHKPNSSFHCISHLTLEDSLELDLGAMREKYVNASESDVSC